MTIQGRLKELAELANSVIAVHYDDCYGKPDKWVVVDFVWRSAADYRRYEYRELARGISINDALRRAKKEVMQTIYRRER